ncbi:hypothetical protein [Rhizobium sp. P007]|uniref:hypothetical protein n=1 Tax=Rhizobium sp. P007 TaxID=285908 RepID=UPI0011576989|nr:hypothetical protein [Rhizobium sp. P007]CAD7041103.1 hypothetical protein RP007_00708 [Rhizobium sp. P007]
MEKVKFFIKEGYMFVADFTASIDKETKEVKVSKGTSVPELMPYQPLEFFVSCQYGFLTIYDTEEFSDEDMLKFALDMTGLERIDAVSTYREIHKIFNEFKKSGWVRPILDLSGCPMKPTRDIEYLRTVPGFIINDNDEISLDLKKVQSFLAGYTTSQGGEWKRPDKLYQVPNAMLLIDGTVIDFDIYQSLGYIVRERYNESHLAFTTHILINGPGLHINSSKAS